MHRNERKQNERRERGGVGDEVGKWRECSYTPSLSSIFLNVSAWLFLSILPSMSQLHHIGREEAKNDYASLLQRKSVERCRTQLSKEPTSIYSILSFRFVGGFLNDRRKASS